MGLLKAKEVDNKVGDKATGESISPSASREVVSHSPFFFLHLRSR